MRVRVYVGPVIGSGTRRDPFRPHLTDALPAQHSAAHVLPSLLDGTPGSTHVLSAVYADDHSALEADPEVQDIFQGAIPDDVNTKPELLVFLRQTTLGDLPRGKQAAITALMDEHGALTVDLDASTPLFRVQQRYTSALLEADESFGTAF